MKPEIERIFDDINGTIIGSYSLPKRLIADPIIEACVLSGRIVAAEMGKPWDWKGVSLKDFTDPHYRVGIEACEWLEYNRESCTQKYVLTVVDAMGADLAATSKVSVRQCHVAARFFDKAWSYITLKEFPYLDWLKILTRNRNLLNIMDGIYECVNTGKSPDSLLDELAAFGSVKSRKSRATWK